MSNRQFVPAEPHLPIRALQTREELVWLGEEIKSGKARGQTRWHVGFVGSFNHLGQPVTFRWHEKKNAPMRVRADSWARYQRRQVSWSGGPTIWGSAHDPRHWKVGREEAEARVVRAIKTHHVQAGLIPGQTSALAGMMAETIEAHADIDPEQPRFRPTPFDISDFLTALDWWTRLATPSRRGREKRAAWRLCYEQELVLIRASGPGDEWLGKADIARRLGRSEQVIGGHYEGAVNEIWRNANVPREVMG